jgi:hypothetical protein
VLAPIVSAHACYSLPVGRRDHAWTDGHVRNNVRQGRLLCVENLSGLTRVGDLEYTSRTAGVDQQKVLITLAGQRVGVTVDSEDFASDSSSLLRVELRGVG